MSSEWFCCDKCPKSFGTRGRYNQHLKTHSRPFRCESCQRGFALRRDLDRHMNARHRVGHEPLRCLYDSLDRRCDFESNRKDNLARHLRNFHGDELAASKGEVRQGTVTNGDHSPSQGPSTSLMSINSPSQFYNLSVFMQAATTANIDILKAALREGIDLHSKAKDGSTALHCAARAGQTATVQYLIESGARTEDTNAKNRTPLEEAIIGRNAETVETLLGASPTVKIHYAVEDFLARSESLEIIQMYISRVPEVSRRALMHRIFAASLRSGQKVLAANLLNHPDLPKNREKGTSRAPIHEAARYGQVEALNLLLKLEGIDVNSKTQNMSLTALHLAASRGHHEIVETLLKHPSIMVNIKTRYGYTPLSLAAEQGYAKVVKHLLNRHDIHVNNTHVYRRLTPLHLSASKGHLEVVKLLLTRADVDVNRTDSEGRTPLHHAASSGCLDVVKLLFTRANVNINDQDCNKWTPVHLAVISGHLEVVEFLLNQDGTDINCETLRDRSLLHLASLSGHSKIVKTLLSQPSIETRYKTRTGWSALYAAAFGEHWDVVSMLLDHWELMNSQAKISEPASNATLIDKSEQLTRLWKHPDFEDIESKRFSGDTLLHCCTKQKGLSVLQSALSRENVDVNVVNDDGLTPLFVAAQYNYVEAVRLLLQHKDINVNCGNIGDGETPVGCARFRGFMEITNLLLSHGALNQDYISPIANNEGSNITEVPFLGTTVQPEPELETQSYPIFDEYMADFRTDYLDMDDIFDMDEPAWSFSGESM